MNSLDNNITASDKDNPEIDQQIHFMLKAVEARVNEMKNKVTVSQEMLPLGVDTDLTVEFRNILDNPISHLLKMRNEMDTSIGGLIKIIAKEYFKTFTDKISKVCVIDSGLNSELHLYFILKEDNSESRELIYNFLSEYKSTQLWNEFPVYFQIVPPSLKDKISSTEILLEN